MHTKCQCYIRQLKNKLLQVIPMQYQPAGKTIRAFNIPQRHLQPSCTFSTMATKRYQRQWREADLLDIPIPKVGSGHATKEDTVIFTAVSLLRDQGVS